MCYSLHFFLVFSTAVGDYAEVAVEDDCSTLGLPPDTAELIRLRKLNDIVNQKIYAISGLIEEAEDSVVRSVSRYSALSETIDKCQWLNFRLCINEIMTFRRQLN